MTELIPQELQNDFDLFQRNEELKYLRGKMAEAVSMMETGMYSIKKLFGYLITRMNAVIDELTELVETAVVPKERFEEFKNAQVTLDEFASYDTLQYYSDLKKLRFLNYGIIVALMRLQDTPARPLASSYAALSEKGVLDTLDDREFIEQGATSPVFEMEQNYIYYTIQEGDTLASIAVRMYDGDASRWIDIARANGITDNDLLDDSMIGRVLKIPVSVGVSASQLVNNMVFEVYYGGASAKSIERYLYGRDIFMQDGKMLPSSMGDLLRMEGITCVLNNLQSRITTIKGALNPLNPDFGVEVPTENNDIPYAVAADRLLTDVEGQIQSDSRVSNAKVLRRSLKVDGDAIYIDVDVELIGGESVVSNFSLENIL